MKKLILFLIGFLFTAPVFAQMGCTDPNATNYTVGATLNDGSCTYPTTSYTLSNPRVLPASLNENSGLIYTNGQLWTLNDGGGDRTIYRISETDGSILQTVIISNATNVDWEAITTDAEYFYIGDFGNNANGNRTDLKIYRVSKTAIGTNATSAVTADIINFSYPDQVIQNPVTTGANSTKFDCEAFLVKDNLLHLFTKDWISFGTVHYTLPATPGTFVATRQEEFMVNGLITDAHIATTNTNQIVLTGYSSDLSSLFMWLLFDYGSSLFFTGNRRRIELGSASQGQIEGVTFTSNGNGYISSERITGTVFGIPVEVSPKLFSFSTDAWVPLPVEFLSFRATYSAPTVTLVWQTASENQNDFFTIERAPDALNFKKLDQLNGAGNSGIIQRYSYTDANPATGINYYRLMQTDWDGTFSYSPIVSVNVKKQPSFWRVSPVPVSVGQPLHIQLTSSLAPGTSISLHSLDGKIFVEKAISHPAEEISTLNFRPGVYILKLKSNTTLQVAKVILQ